MTLPPNIRLSPKHPLCFIHLPKTGGTTLREFILRVFPDQKFGSVPQHGSGRKPKILIDDEAMVFSGHFDYQTWMGHEIEPQFVTILRHPVERMISLYYFWKSHSFQHIDEKWNGFPTTKGCKRSSLKQFVESENPQIGAYMFNSQSRQLVNGLFEPWHKTDEELLAQVLRNLHGFKAVGLTDQLETMMKWISKVTGSEEGPISWRVNSNESLKERFPNSYFPKPNSFSDSIIDQIKKLNLIDIVIYEWANTQWKSGSFSVTNSLESDISMANQRLQELRTQLGLKSEFSVGHYFAGKKSKKYKTWLNSRTLRAGQITIEASPRRLTYNGKRTRGFQINKLVLDIENDTSMDVFSPFNRSIGFVNSETINSARLLVATSNKLTPCSPIRRLEWFDNPASDISVCDTEFDPEGNKTHLRDFKIILDQFYADLDGFCYGTRDLKYLERRYFKNPLTIYTARLVSDIQTGHPLALVFLTHQDYRLKILDFIGSFSVFDRVMDCLRAKINAKNILSVRFMLPENVIKNFEIFAPGNLSTNFHSISSELGSGSNEQNIYFTAGDTDFF